MVQYVESISDIQSTLQEIRKVLGEIVQAVVG
jgi:hypothetical protein